MTISTFLDKIGRKINYPLLIVCIIFNLIFYQLFSLEQKEYLWLNNVRVIIHSLVLLNVELFLTTRIFIPMPSLVSKKWVILGRIAVIILMHFVLFLYIFCSILD